MSKVVANAGLVALTAGLVSCAPGTLGPGGSGGGVMARMDASADVLLDDAPFYRCPPPPDDALILAADSVVGDEQFEYVGSGDWSGYFSIHTYLGPAPSSLICRVGRDVITDEACVKLFLHEDSLNPLAWQGEYEQVGDDRSGPQYIEMTWDIAGIVNEAFGSNSTDLPRADSRLCISHMRPDRIVGTIWFDPVNLPDVNPYPGPMWLSFDIAAPPRRVSEGHGTLPYFSGNDDLRVSTWLDVTYYDIIPRRIWGELSDYEE
ncbi:MAG: hypothetical protein GXP62_06965 [Oligoflexia bacterium]|nr:hypothetical protein [Oligoflexia bacterium]